jgi:hypothetical protein
MVVDIKGNVGAIRDGRHIYIDADAQKAAHFRKGENLRCVLLPGLGAVIDVQDFYGFGFHSIDHNVRERCHDQFSCAATVAGSAAVGCSPKPKFQRLWTVFS